MQNLQPAKLQPPKFPTCTINSNLQPAFCPAACQDGVDIYTRSNIKNNIFDIYVITLFPNHQNSVKSSPKVQEMAFQRLYLKISSIEPHACDVQLSFSTPPPPYAKTKSASYGTALQNKDIQKVDLSNHCNAMIHHQKADATGLARLHLWEVLPPGRPPF